MNLGVEERIVESEQRRKGRITNVLHTHHSRVHGFEIREIPNPTRARRFEIQEQIRREVLEHVVGSTLRQVPLVDRDLAMGMVCHRPRHERRHGREQNVLFHLMKVRGINPTLR